MKFIICIFSIILLLSCGGSQKGQFDGCDCKIDAELFDSLLVEVFTEKNYRILYSPFNVGEYALDNEYLIRMVSINSSRDSFSLELATVGVLKPFNWSFPKKLDNKLSVIKPLNLLS